MPSLDQSFAKALTDDFKDSDSGAFKEFLRMGVEKLPRKYLETDSTVPRKEIESDSKVALKCLETDSKQNRNKLVTKCQQTSNKVITNYQQTSNKLVTKTNNKKSPIIETGNATDNKTSNKVITNYQQTSNKVVTKTAFISLSGLQRKCMLFIYSQCQINANNITPCLSIESLSVAINASAGSSKMTINRLVEKGLITKHLYKNGRGGWTQYKITETIYSEILQSETSNKVVTNYQQTSNKVVTQPTTQLVTALSSSSSDIDNTNIENTATTEEWKIIDTTPLEHIGFGQGQLKQIILKNKLTADQVQDSINHFAFDLKHNNKKCNTGPLNMFMSIVSRDGEPYLPPDNYEHPRDKALRLYSEKQRQVEANRGLLEKEAKRHGFNAWFDGLDDAEIEKISGMKLDPNLGLKFMRQPLKRHYEENLWPIRRKQII